MTTRLWLSQYLDTEGNDANLSCSDAHVSELVSSYAGRFILDLRLGPDEENIFRSDITGGDWTTIDIPTSVPPFADDESFKKAVLKALSSSFSDSDLFPDFKRFEGIIRFIEKKDISPDSRSGPILEALSTQPVSNKLAELSLDELTSMLRSRKRIHFHRSMYGTLTYDYFTPTIGYIEQQEKNVLLDNVFYGSQSYDISQQYITIGSINGRSPVNGINLSGKNRITVTMKGTARPKHRDTNIKHGRFRSKSLPLTIYPVKTVKLYFSTVPESGNFGGDATQVSPGSWRDWSFSCDVSADDMATGRGEKSFIITARAEYNDLDEPEDTSVGISVFFSDNVISKSLTEACIPHVKITSPSKGENRSGDSAGVTVQIEGTASDSSCGCGLKTIEVTTDDNIGLYSEAIPRSPGNWSTWTIKKTFYSQGYHAITARCIDNGGNVDQDRIYIKVTIAPTTHISTHLLLLERYHLSSYLGPHQANRIIKIVSIPPRKKTRICIKFFASDIKSRNNEGSCILDSFTQNSSDNFELLLANENADKHIYDHNYKFYLDTDSEPGWGFGGCILTPMVADGTNSARQEFAKSISNALQKHVSKASANRGISVYTPCSLNTNTENEHENYMKKTSDFELENTNSSRTLTFVFKQYEQVYYSILHLTDIRVAILRRERVEDGSRIRVTYREATLPQLDALLAEVLIKDERELKQKVTRLIIHQLENIQDYQDKPKSLIQGVALRDQTGNYVQNLNYLRVRKDIISEYVDPSSPDIKIQVPGIITSVIRNSLRTEGTLITPYVGQTNALDLYSTGIQNENLKKAELDNKNAGTEISRNLLAMKIVEERETDSAKLFSEVFPCCKPNIFSLWPPKEKRDASDQDQDDRASV